MTYWHGLKVWVLGVLTVFILVTQTQVQVHLSYNGNQERNNSTEYWLSHQPATPPSEAWSSSSKKAANLAVSDLNRLKRSLRSDLNGLSSENDLEVVTGTLAKPLSASSPSSIIIDVIKDNVPEYPTSQSSSSSKFSLLDSQRLAGGSTTGSGSYRLLTGTRDKNTPTAKVSDGDKSYENFGNEMSSPKMSSLPITSSQNSESHIDGNSGAYDDKYTTSPILMTLQKDSFVVSSSKNVDMFPGISEQERIKHVTNWSATPEKLFIRNFYTPGFSVVNRERCSVKGEELTLMILVTTAVTHFEQRNAVRMTWAHFAKRRDVQFAFVIGDLLLHEYKESTKEDLEKEMDLYQDFVVTKSEDKYRNLALKTLHMLDWMGRFCDNAKYFLKTDDDVFLNIPNILKHIESVKKEDKTKPKIYGHIFSGHLASRNVLHRHFVDFDVYPYNLTYPNFTSGPAYLMRSGIAKPLLKEALRLPFIPLEDVLVTGYAAMNLGIPRVDLAGFINEIQNPVTLVPCDLVSIFAGMTDGSASQMSYVWYNYLVGRSICSWRTRR